MIAHFPPQSLSSNGAVAKFVFTWKLDLGSKQPADVVDGTGDFRIGMLDSGGKRVTRDGIGYKNGIFSGYKGYGMGLLVEVLSAVLPGASFLSSVYPKDKDGRPLPANLGHFFGAWRLDAFRPADEFKADLDRFIRELKGGNLAAGASRIYVHGEKEFEQADHRSEHGIPLEPKVEASLKQIAAELGVAYGL